MPTENNAEKSLELLHTQLGDLNSLLTKSKADVETQYRELHNHYDGVKADNEALKKTVEEKTAEYAEMAASVQAITKAVDDLKKEIDQPIYKGGKDLEDSDRRAAIELQRRAHIFKGGDPDEFREDTSNLVNPGDYRSAVRKLMKVGIENKKAIIRSFTDAEQKAFDMASLDSAFFSPELLGLEVDCNVECASLIDLYDRVSVTKSTFMYPKIVDYGAIGQYDCSAKCDAEFGPEGNITYLNGKIFDFRGVFCFQKKVLAEANYPLLEFMFGAAARSYRINRNIALIKGKGVNEPLGWLTASEKGDCFPKRATGAVGTFTHIDFRQFMGTLHVEYGRNVAVMHQNMFAYLAAKTDCCGRFIYGDGLFTFSPDALSDFIRISNCLPDSTEGGTKGSADVPFDSGAFLLAAGAWDVAYAAVDKRPLFIEQWEGETTAWCVKYQFGAEDGGFVKCCEAASILTVQ